MTPLLRSTLAIALSVALNAAALRMGGLWLDRAPEAPPPERLKIELALFQPPPEPAAAAPEAPPEPEPVVQEPPPSEPEPPPVVERPEPPPPAPVATFDFEPLPEPPPEIVKRPALPEARPWPPPAPQSRPVPQSPWPEAEPRVLETPPEPEPPVPNVVEQQTPRPNPPPQAPEPEEELVFPKSRADHSALVSTVRDGIDAAKRYPRLARQAGFEGRTLLKFRLLRSGDVEDLRVLESSGYEILDDAAMGAVRRAAPFPDEGRKLSGESIEVILPVVFRLR
jgi:protein TonB